MKYFVVLSLLWQFPLFAQQETATVVAPFTTEASYTAVTREKGVNQYLLLKPDRAAWQRILEQKPRTLALEVPVPPMGSVVLELEQREIFGSFLPVYARNAAGAETVVYTPGLYYRGKIRGEAGSVAAVSFFQDEIIAVFSDSRGNMVLGNKTDDKGLPLADQLVVYNDRDLDLPFEIKCSADALNGPGKTHVQKGFKKMMPAGNCQVEEIYFECDYQMYLDRGSSVTNVVNYLTGIVNVVAAIQELHGMKIVLHSTLVWTVDDPYSTTSSVDALFGLVATQLQVADFHHLLSTNSNNLGGVAFVADDLCSLVFEGNRYNYAYSNIQNTYENFPLYSWTVMVVTHENGHNLGTPHTHWCGWPSGRLDNCGPSQGYYDNGTCPDGPTPTNGTVMSYCHLVGSIGINLSLGFGTWPDIGPTDLVTDEMATNSCFVNPVIGSLSASGNGPVCEGSPIVLSASAHPGATIKWLGPGGYYSESAVSVIPNASAAQGGQYKAVATYVGCSTDTLYISVPVIPGYTAPASLTATPALVNAGESALLQVAMGTLQPGASWQWYANNCGIEPVGAGTSISVNPTVSTEYFVRAEGACPSSPCASISVAVQNNDCIADLNLSGTVETSDLLLFLGALGCAGTCIGDFTNDGFVNTSDLLIFLSYFGVACP